MNELDFEQPEQPEQPEQVGEAAQTQAPGTKKVEGRDPATVRLKRAYEAEVENKVASDYSHIVWAYGVIWAIFAIYGALLWRRAVAQRADLAALQAKQK
ncbi:hypothetical protein DB30_06071 [Enhygromyxa salina]|uniref:Uncharacterized protein n=1 Tax=Enhygromyxa salina TaxID=215803 RepID=A0A0C1ZBF3_9BACT|nr:hypothetical protein [Enhygromyxa salina]KIG15039.1 hypothetical protein DB30_06071 [Enhygromyxa salina]